VAACNDEPIAAAVVDLVPDAGQTQSTQTAPSGSYSFTALNQETWTIRPSIDGQHASAITQDDVDLALEAAVGTRTLTPEEFLAADVTGNGQVTSEDASLIKRYTMGSVTQFPVALLCSSDWILVPDADPMSGQVVHPPEIGSGTCTLGTIVLDPLNGAVDNRNFRAILFGDVDGSWPNNGGGS
jgi:hypothetical protein